MISLENVVFNYGVDDLKFDFHLKQGENLALIGSSGAGKSTLLNLIAGFYKPRIGKIIINDQNVTELAPYLRPITIMFQEHNLFPHLTVEQNIIIGMSTNLKLSEEDKIRLKEIIVQLGLEGLEARYPRQLSGGQRQRVALARCLLRRKPILLLDEPFTGLDPFYRKEMIELINSLKDKYNLTIIMATHYIEDALKLCNKIAFLLNNTIYKLGDIREVLSEDIMIQGFLGKE